MKHLYFLRHGESEFNKANTWSGSSDTPLTSKGVDQAKQAGQKAHKKALKFDLIITSPLSRAKQTALIFAEQMGYNQSKVLVRSDTVERNFGELEGNKNLVASTKYFIDEASIDQYKDVEKLKDLQKRADKFYEYLMSLDAETILVVGHGAFGRALRRRINNRPLSERGSPFQNAELTKFV